MSGEIDCGAGVLVRADGADAEGIAHIGSHAGEHSGILGDSHHVVATGDFPFGLVAGGCPGNGDGVARHGGGVHIVHMRAWGDVVDGDVVEIHVGIVGDATLDRVGKGYVAGRAFVVGHDHVVHHPAVAIDRHKLVKHGEGAEVVGVGHHTHLQFGVGIAAAALIEPEAHHQTVDGGTQHREGKVFI